MVGVTSSGAAPPSGGRFGGAARAPYLRLVPGTGTGGLGVRRFDTLRVEATRMPDGSVRAAASGDLDLATAPELESQLLGLCTPETQRLTIDLSALSFLDCAGLSTMRRVEALCGARGCAVEIVTAPGPAQRLIELVTEFETR
jgi:anti-sigma B factor antagonist